MNALVYDFELLKRTREKKKISALNMAAELCLAERQILSLEQNSLQYFPSSSLRYSVLKKYIFALELQLEDVIFNLDELDPTPALLKKKE